MHVPHNAHVLVVDGRKMLFFKNEGDGEYPNLQVVQAEDQVNPADRDQKTDAAGGSSGSQMGANAPAAAQGGGAGAGGQGNGFAPSRGTMDEVDFHQQEEDRFAAHAAEMLKKQVLAHKVDKLVVIAPPKTLGELRKHYHKEVESRIAGELAKDLTGHPVADIEKALQNA